MEMELWKSDSVEEVLAAGPYPGLRMFTVTRISQPEAAADVQGTWERAEGEVMRDFSAVGLHFGLDLIEALDSAAENIRDDVTKGAVRRMLRHGGYRQDRDV